VVGTVIGEKGVVGNEAFPVRTSYYVDSVFRLPSSNVCEMHAHTIISVDRVTREVEPGPSSAVKHLLGMRSP
jgi:hypothetical protein